MKLFCFSSAGMGAGGFLKWSEYLKPDIELCPIEYPGHGQLLEQKPLSTMSQLCDYCMDMIEKTMGSRDGFCILGHSLGAMVVYELTKRFNKNSRYQLEKCVLCGCPAPNFLIDYLNGISKMDNEDFINFIFQIGGVPEEILTNPLFLEIYLPIIKHDFMLIEAYLPVLEKLTTPIITINGTEDQLVKNKYQFWKGFSADKNVSGYMMNGNHFFINSTKEITALLNEVL